MNGYKKIIKSAQVRKCILNALSFIPDKTMLKIQYRIKTGRKLNLKNPVRYTEKLQWYKLYYRNPIMKRCVDKYEVRKFLKKRGLEDILVKLYGKYDTVEEINWDSLPDRFVIKTTHGSGGLNVFICDDKSKIDFKDLMSKLKSGNKRFMPKSGGREWAYYGLRPGFVVEELLINEKNPEAGINDYKIFCYDGKPEYIIVDVDRYIGHRRNFYDKDWNNLHVTSDCPAADDSIEKPENLKEMLEVAARLSKGFPYVRVDLYNVSGKIYFGEMTFYPWSGYVEFTPDAFDFEAGKKFALSPYKKCK